MKILIFLRKENIARESLFFYRHISCVAVPKAETQNARTTNSVKNPLFYRFIRVFFRPLKLKVLSKFDNQNSSIMFFVLKNERRASIL